MDYFCRFKSCTPLYSKTLEGLAAIALVKYLIKIRKTEHFEIIFDEVQFFSDFLLRGYTFTVLLKRSVLDLESSDPDLRYFRTELVDLSYKNLLYILHSAFVEQIIFVNNRNGIASLNCALHHKKHAQKLNFFFWTSDIKL